MVAKIGPFQPYLSDLDTSNSDNISKKSPEFSAALSTAGGKTEAFEGSTEFSAALSTARQIIIKG